MLHHNLGQGMHFIIPHLLIHQNSRFELQVICSCRGATIFFDSPMFQIESQSNGRPLLDTLDQANSKDGNVQPYLGSLDGPKRVLETTVSSTELSEFLCPHRVPRRESVSSFGVWRKTQRASVLKQ